MGLGFIRKQVLARDLTNQQGYPSREEEMSASQFRGRSVNHDTFNSILKH